MSVLAGFAIAALVVIGWLAGLLFVCIFLTLPTIPVAFMLTEGFSRAPVVVMLWTVLLALIWMPFLVSRRRQRIAGGIFGGIGIQHLHPPRALLPSSPSGDDRFEG